MEEEEGRRVRSVPSSANDLMKNPLLDSALGGLILESGLYRFHKGDDGASSSYQSVFVNDFDQRDLEKHLTGSYADFCFNGKRVKNGALVLLTPEWVVMRRYLSRILQKAIIDGETVWVIWHLYSADDGKVDIVLHDGTYILTRVLDTE